MRFLRLKISFNQFSSGADQVSGEVFSANSLELFIFVISAIQLWRIGRPETDAFMYLPDYCLTDVFSH